MCLLSGSIWWVMSYHSILFILSPQDPMFSIPPVSLELKTYRNTAEFYVQRKIIELTLDTLQFTTVVQKLSFANHILLDFPVLQIKEITYIIFQSKKNHKLPLSHRIFLQYYTPLTL